MLPKKSVKIGTKYWAYIVCNPQNNNLRLLKKMQYKEWDGISSHGSIYLNVYHV